MKCCRLPESAPRFFENARSIQDKDYTSSSIDGKGSEAQ